MERKMTNLVIIEWRKREWDGTKCRARRLLSRLAYRRRQGVGWEQKLLRAAVVGEKPCGWWLGLGKDGRGLHGRASATAATDALALPLGIVQRWHRWEMRAPLATAVGGGGHLPGVASALPQAGCLYRGESRSAVACAWERAAAQWRLWLVARIV